MPSPEILMPYKFRPAASMLCAAASDELSRDRCSENAGNASDLLGRIACERLKGKQRMTTSNGSGASGGESLTQNRANALIQMEKRPITNTRWLYPGRGGNLKIELRSVDGRERFLFDVTAGRISLRKASYQTRWRRTTVLIRLCVNGPTHRNPDGQLLGNTHLHVYREGYHDKYAIPVPNTFVDLNDQSRVLQDFCAFCNIARQPIYSQRLINDDSQG